MCSLMPTTDRSQLLEGSAFSRPNPGRRSATLLGVAVQVVKAGTATLRPQQGRKIPGTIVLLSDGAQDARHPDSTPG